METIFVARQPIYDRQIRVYAYELLFRSGSENEFLDTDGDHATASVIETALSSAGLT